MQDDNKKRQAAMLKARGYAFWTHLLQSPDMLNLEGAIRRKTSYDKLNREQRITIAVFLTEYERLIDGIETKAASQVTDGQAAQEEAKASTDEETSQESNGQAAQEETKAGTT